MSMIAQRQRARIRMPRFAAALIIFFGLYVGSVELAGLLNLELPGIGPTVSLWAAAGVGLAAVVLYGMEMWPAIGLGALLLCLINGVPLLYTAGAVAAAVLQPIVGAYILRKFNFDPRLSHIGDTLLIFAVAFSTGLLFPLANVGLMVLDGSLVPMLAGTYFSVHWLGNVLSISVVASTIIRWHRKPFPRTASEIAENVTALAVLIAADSLVFLTSFQSQTTLPLFYLILFPLLWISLRIGPRGMTLALLVTSGIALAGIAKSGSVTAVALINIESLLIALTVLFLIYVSSEEGRKDAMRSMQGYVVRLEAALQRIRSEDRTKSEFIAVLAHELRNPLAAIRTSVEVIDMETEGNQNVRPLVAAVDERIRTTARLLDDLLDISRISQRKLELRREELSVRDIIDRSLHAVDPQLRSRGHTVSLRVSDDCAVVADPMRLEQVVVNLLTNAIKYTPVGGTIGVSCRREGGRVFIAVSDTGIGISPDMLERIFEPFVQVTKSTYNSSGLGIGLALTKQLVEMHGGSIHAESAGADRGSTFMVDLPAAERAGAGGIMQQYLRKRVIAERTMVPTLEQSSQSGTRILVVDDNQLAAQGLCKLLQLRGYTAEPAYTGEQALVKSQSWRPDIIILDIGLPGMNGYQVARSLRDDYAFGGAIIALTGYGQEKDRQKSAAAGFDRHLVKPVGLAEIETVLGEVLSAGRT